MVFTAKEDKARLRGHFYLLYLESSVDESLLAGSESEREGWQLVESALSMRNAQGLHPSTTQTQPRGAWL